MACCGLLVVTRAARADITLAFLACWAAVLFGRSWSLGEPMAIPIHRLQSGALLLFAFFMISDPKTTPDSRVGRIIFAALVAAGAWYVQFRLFRTNGLLWSLAAVSLLTPLIDLIFPGPRYEWRGAPIDRRSDRTAPAQRGGALHPYPAAPGPAEAAAPAPARSF
jgi:Na+-translocating ferredoxin:NAD+ oxidoreductase RnfD subunit